MRVRCTNCQGIITSITPKGRRYYCKPKGIWIPERKLGKNRRCGYFSSLKDKILAAIDEQRSLGEPNPLKTPLMRALEREYNKPLEELLVNGSLSVVSEKLRVDTSTVSKWKKKLGLERKDNHNGMDT